MPLAAALPPAAPFLYLRREPPPHPLNPPAKGRQNPLNSQNPGTKGAEPSRPKGAVHKGTHLPSDNALRAMSIKSALRDCLPALIVILTPGEEFWYM